MQILAYSTYLLHFIFLNAIIFFWCMDFIFKVIFPSIQKIYICLVTCLSLHIWGSKPMTNMRMDRDICPRLRFAFLGFFWPFGRYVGKEVRCSFFAHSVLPSGSSAERSFYNEIDTP